MFSKDEYEKRKIEAEQQGEELYILIDGDDQRLIIAPKDYYITIDGNYTLGKINPECAKLYKKAEQKDKDHFINKAFIEMREAIQNTKLTYKGCILTPNTQTISELLLIKCVGNYTWVDEHSKLIELIEEDVDEMLKLISQAIQKKKDEFAKIVAKIEMATTLPDLLDINVEYTKE